MFDLVVRGGTVVAADGVMLCDIGIRDGRIVALAMGLAAGKREVDATGLYVLPGGIDSHVHISQPSGDGIVMADDFQSGTRSALFGGNTTIMPFCLQEKGQSLRDALTAYHALAEGQCLTDISFHMIITDPVSYTHLDVYKRQGFAEIRRFEGLAPAMLDLGNGCLLYTSRCV